MALRPHRPTLRPTGLWWGIAAVLVASGISLGLLVSRLAASRGESAAPVPPPASVPRVAVTSRPVPAASPRTHPAPTRPPALRRAQRGVAAIIFDDAGNDLSQLEPILALHAPVAVAVLPGLPASRAVAERARAHGLEVLLHLPLEAEDEARPLGPGAVTIAMDTEAIKAQVRAGLADVPGALGVNGHMGSRATADRRVMTAVLEVVREEGLFFVDSRTTIHTVALPVARELGVRAAERVVFLDNSDDPEVIAAQVRRLIAEARRRGSAVAIGHVQKITAEVVYRLLPEFHRAGVVLVPVSSVVR